MSRTLVIGILAVGAMALSSGDARAVFVPIEDFEGLTLGPVDDQNGWFADDATSEVAADPDDSNNQLLSVPTASTFLFHAVVVPEGEARMLFLRFRYEDQLTVSFGMSESSFPDQFGNFEPELSLTSATDDLRINDGGTYSTLTFLEAGRWYNCWLYVDNAADITSVWLHDRPGESATETDKLEIDDRDEFPFRQGTANDLQNLFIKTGGGDGVAGPLILDDIYLQNSSEIDLSCPVVEVAGVGSLPAPMQLHGSTPNPFNPQTTIYFTLNEPQSVELTVYDLNGRRIAVLDEGQLATGLHAVDWGGRDQAGNSVASGVYFVRLVGEASLQTAKITLVR